MRVGDKKPKDNIILVLKYSLELFFFVLFFRVFQFKFQKVLFCLIIHESLVSMRPAAQRSITISRHSVAHHTGFLLYPHSIYAHAFHQAESLKQVHL